MFHTAILETMTIGLEVGLEYILSPIGNSLNSPQAMNRIQALKHSFRDISIAENKENPDSLLLSI